MKHLLFILLGIMVTGCVTSRYEKTPVGTPRERVLEKLGQPTQIREENGMTVFKYYPGDHTCVIYFRDDMIEMPVQCVDNHREPSSSASFWGGVLGGAAMMNQNNHQNYNSGKTYRCPISNGFQQPCGYY